MSRVSRDEYLAAFHDLFAAMEYAGVSDFRDYDRSTAEGSIRTPQEIRDIAQLIRRSGSSDGMGE